MRESSRALFGLRLFRRFFDDEVDEADE